MPAQTTAADATSTIVIGAGMVGVAAAWHLLKRGRTVTLVDRRDPGEETSYGNAGVIIGGIDIPVAMPRDPAEIARIALNRTSYIRYRPSLLPQLAPWLWAFYRATSAERLEASARASQPLFARAIAEHKAMAASAGADDLLRDDGWIELFRDPSGLEATALNRKLAQDYGVDFNVLDGDTLRDLEPSLNPVARAAIHWKNITSTGNPGRLTKAYAADFTKNGGQVVTAGVRALERADGGWRVTTDGASLQADEVVVAAGIWSKALLAPLGYRMMMVAKRGYHMHFRPAGNAGLTRPVVDGDYGYVLAPMEQGIRVTTGVEFDNIYAPPNRAQLDAVLPQAKALFPLDEPVEDTPWLGRRPAFPDQLPVIGRAPRHDGLWVDFGHAHWGLTLGPVSGRLLAEQMTGKPLCATTEAVEPERYLG